MPTIEHSRRGAPSDAQPARRVALVFLVASVVAVVAGCAQAAVPVPLSELAAEQERYDGERVRTAGTVVAIRDRPDAEEYYVLEDEASNRVAVFPEEVVRDHVGRRVGLEGVFVFDERWGRLLRDAELVEAAD